MIRYSPANQLTLEGFSTPFDQHLDKKNRWVILADLVPWDRLAQIYARHLKLDSGRLSVDIRCVIASTVIKYKEKLSDRGRVQSIQENVYMQYFCGFTSLTNKPPFEASLFVDIRKRLGT